MVAFMGLPSTVDMEALLYVLAAAKEFSKTILKRSDKAPLNEINKRARFRSKGRVQSPELKVFHMLQAVLGAHDFEDFGLRCGVHEHAALQFLAHSLCGRGAAWRPRRPWRRPRVSCSRSRVSSPTKRSGPPRC